VGDDSHSDGPDVSASHSARPSGPHQSGVYSARVASYRDGFALPKVRRMQRPCNAGKDSVKNEMLNLLQSKKINGAEGGT
jgi:hypothetical protein